MTILVNNAGVHQFGATAVSFARAGATVVVSGRLTGRTIYLDGGITAA